MSESPLRPKGPFVKDLQIKEEIEGLYLVKYLQVNQARDGRSYLNIVLGDNSGDIEGRSWKDAEQIEARVKKGDFVFLAAKVNHYLGKKQLILSRIEVVGGDEVEQADFVVKAARNPDEMFEELRNRLGELDDFYIRELLTQVLGDFEIQRRLKTWQAGKTIHHAYQAGLLEHILSCTQLAFLLSAHYQVNRNYVVAGAILHDLCKIYELSDGLNVDYTEEGKLVGHLVKAIELIDRFCYRIKNFPYDLKMHLKHIVLSHHGKYEYGSPKIPQTSEAYLVHLIDLMDSKMNSLEAIKRSDRNEGHWSAFVKHLDRIVFKAPLPFYPEELPSDAFKQEATKSKKNFKPPKSSTPKMGSLLKDFKL